LNVQHNCFDGCCKMTHTQCHYIEFQETSHYFPEVSHSELNSYIINAGAQYSVPHHCDFSQQVWHEVTSDKWADGVSSGLQTWKVVCPPKPQ
ncbi:hypothetical protein CROQUDRAFT_11303, partial [Cronartium quercuum f. sp. fusiforme G11]